MTHTFLLIVYLGQKIINQDMYFYDVDRCRYFAERITKQPAVPNRTAGEDVPKTMRYTAVCEPRRVNPSTVSIY